jgi:hypothetical protein
MATGSPTEPESRLRSDGLKNPPTHTRSVTAGKQRELQFLLVWHRNNVGG